MANYTEILQYEFQKKQHQDGMSLRSFAKNIEVSPAYLSRVLNGKRSLSKKMAEKIAGNLWAKKSEIKAFCELVEPEKSKDWRDSARKQGKMIEIKQEKFKILAEWHHLAILELFYLDGFQPTVQWISKRLGINPLRVSVAIDRLKQTKILDLQESVLRPEAFSRFVKSTPSKYIRQFHQDMLEKAIKALHEQPPESRNISGSITYVDSSKVPEANKMIEEFREKLTDFLTDSEKKDAVYFANVNLFRLDKNFTMID